MNQVKIDDIDSLKEFQLLMDQTSQIAKDGLIVNKPVNQSELIQKKMGFWLQLYCKFWFYLSLACLNLVKIIMKHLTIVNSPYADITYLYKFLFNNITGEEYRSGSHPKNQLILKAMADHEDYLKSKRAKNANNHCSDQHTNCPREISSSSKIEILTDGGISISSDKEFVLESEELHLSTSQLNVNDRPAPPELPVRPSKQVKNKTLNKRVKPSKRNKNPRSKKLPARKRS